VSTSIRLQKELQLMKFYIYMNRILSSLAELLKKNTADAILI